MLEPLGKKMSKKTKKEKHPERTTNVSEHQSSVYYALKAETLGNEKEKSNENTKKKMSLSTKAMSEETEKEVRMNEGRSKLRMEYEEGGGEEENGGGGGGGGGCSFKKEYDIMEELKNCPYTCGVIKMGQLPDDICLTKAGTKASGQYIIMELCERLNLSDIRKNTRCGYFGPITGARIGIEIIRAIQSLHENGYIHRDIKPVYIYVYVY
ncbi:hypothetical protein RFI_22307, partial [Reticulomyxa filosa]